MLWQEYTTSTFELGLSEHLPDVEDILKPQSDFWSQDQRETCASFTVLQTCASFLWSSALWSGILWSSAELCLVE